MGSSINGRVIWLLKQAHSGPPLLWLKEGSAPKNRWNAFSVILCLPLPCHWHLGDAFFAKQGFLYSQSLLLWVRPAGFGDFLILLAEWKSDILTWQTLFFLLLLFPLVMGSYVISLLSQWLMFNFCAINFSLFLTILSTVFFKQVFSNVKRKDNKLKINIHLLPENYTHKEWRIWGIIQQGCPNCCYWGFSEMKAQIMD